MSQFRKDIDKDAILEGALELFWANGYDDTSYDDLVSVTGANRKTLYGLFGDKRGLFLAVLNRYRFTISKTRFSVLEEPDVTRDDIRQLVTKLGELAVSPEGARGCLISNTAVDRIGKEPAVKRHVDAYLEEMMRRFETALIRAYFTVEEAQDLSAYLTGVLQSVFLMARSRMDGAILRATLSRATAALN